MDREKLSDKILDKIKNTKIEPKPRWYFLMKNYTLYLFGALALIFGALGMSVLIYLLKYNDWQSGLHIDNFLGFILMTLPYFWIIFFTLFVFIIYYNIKHSQKGYRYPAYLIISFAFLASVILGEIFFVAGFGEKIDDILGRKAPLYKEMFNPQMNFWFNPEAGRLAGLIFFEENADIYLIDHSGKIWNILLVEESKVNIVDRSNPSPAHLLGQVIAENVFEAKMIEGARPGKSFMNRPGHDPLYRNKLDKLMAPNN